MEIFRILASFIAVYYIPLATFIPSTYPLRHMIMLRAENLGRSDGRQQRVSGFNLDLQKGEIVGLLGRNGAGKTTSFRITIGMILPNAGQVVFNGEDLAGLPMYKRAQRGIGYLSHRLSCRKMRK